MTKNETTSNLLSCCKYYKGNENEQPKDGDPLICWNTEKAWINRTGKAKQI